VGVWDALVEGKLTVSLGKGDAWVSFEQTEVKKDVSITTNNGDDTISFAPEFEDDEWEGDAEGEGDDDYYYNNFFGKVTVNTGSGSDEVVIASARVAGALAVNTGDGEDGVALWQVQADSTVSINTGKHSDVIGVVELLAKGNVTVDSGNAGAGFSDRVILTDSDMDKDLSVKAGDGDDEVGIGDSDNIAAALAALLEEFGWDDFGIESGAVEVLGKFTVATGSGIDFLSIGWCDIAGSAAVDTGSGNDLCEILDTTVGAGASVKMGAGDDGLGTGDIHVTGKVTLDGGSGLDDVWEAWGDNTYTELVYKGFETLPF